MGAQIMDQLGNYVTSNIFALVLIVTAARWPKVARLFISVLFVGGGIWNLFASLTMPEFYVTTYGPLATPPYQAFIYGPFAVNPALFVVPIAIGELAIGAAAAGRGTWGRPSMVGMTAFMLGLAPLGVGGAFPFSIFAIVAGYLLYRKPLATSLFEDVGATAAALTHTFQPRAQARPHN
jgi:hypothetical protein